MKILKSVVYMSFDLTHLTTTFFGGGGERAQGSSSGKRPNLVKTASKMVGNIL